MTRSHRFLSIVLLSSVLWSPAALASDWPTYQRDIARSGVTEETLEFPLNEVWLHKARHAPRPAWPAPAPRDIWHEIRELRPTVTYDRAFHPVVAGATLFFGSSADDGVYALDTASGEVRWRFFADGPVRLAPTIADGRVYFGSDDGCVYCLRAEDGKLLWKHQGAPADHRVPGNGRIISLYPVRTGVLVDNGVAYCCAGLFPGQGVRLHALDAKSGKVIWSEEDGNLSPQGYLLASATRLFVPTGRTSPAIYARADAKTLGTVPGPGGAYALLAGDTLLSGPGRRGGTELGLADTETREGVASYAGIRMIVRQDMAYLQSKEELSALNRARHTKLSRERNAISRMRDELKESVKGKEDSEQGKMVLQEVAALEKQMADLSAAMDACFLWKRRSEHPYALILAGDALFGGGEGEVAAFSVVDGAEMWSARVPGRVYGLAVAGERLYASTDQGAIHCFAPQRVERETVVQPFDNPHPYADDRLTGVFEEAARRVLDTSGISKGYCLVLGCGDGRLAYELVRQSDLRVVCLEENAGKVNAVRAVLEDAGLYGARVTVHQAKLDDLPLGSYVANLIVSETALVSGELAFSASEAARVLRPSGGVICLGQPQAAARMFRTLKQSEAVQWLQETGLDDASVTTEDGVWAVAKRGPIPTGGEWTQLYSNPSHTAASSDQLRDPMTIQWFGEPGPRNIIDRHHRPMSPLSKHGRVFVPADDRVIAVDAYNGTLLWQLEVPNSRRVGALKNSGHMILTDRHLYIVVKDECWAVDAATGVREFVLKAPAFGKEPHDWGYVNLVGDQLFGTVQKPGASFSMLALATVNTLEGDFRPVMVSEGVFSVDRFSGKRRWQYEGGAVMNNAITIGDDRVYFVESGAERVVGDKDGRVRIDFFNEERASLVALGLRKGRSQWRTPVAFPFQHIMFLTYAENTVLATGTYNREGKVYYGLYAFHGDTGEPKWNTEFLALDIRGNDCAPTGGSHGEQWQHPVIIGSTIYLRPYAFDLHTGKKLDYIFRRGGHGCGGVTASAYYLYGRGDNPRMYPTEVDSTSGIQLTRVSRPGCWLNILPVGGLVVIPESSSGCTCAYPLQTSIALAPKAVSGLE